MVDFLEIVLANVADPKIAGHGIKRKAEWIAQTEQPDFRAAALVAKGLLGGIA